MQSGSVILPFARERVICLLSAKIRGAADESRLFATGGAKRRISV